MFLTYTLRRLDDRELDAWIRAQDANPKTQSRGIQEFRRRQEACHREHDLLSVRLGLGVAAVLASAAFVVVWASNGLLR